LPPVPLSLSPEQAAEGSFDNRLIDTEGRLLHKILGKGYLRLTFEGDRQFFGASLELSSPISGNKELAKSLEEGSTLRLVGVCVSRAVPEEAGGSAFMVLLRSTDDVRVVSPPPWWGLKHAVWVGCVALILVSMVYLVRNRILSQRYKAIVEERGRIAREMHDSLAQGFSGLTYQLEGLASELNASAERASIARHLGQALQLVRHCSEEAHRSIFALRSLAQTDPDLLALLMASCKSMRIPGEIRVAGVSEGRSAPISDDTMNHLLRIGQEAITNALRHSGSTVISVLVRFDESDVTLCVADNGRGFDVASAASVEMGHFGVQGMKERAKHIGGRIEIASTQGSGTTVTVRAATTRRSFLRVSFPLRQRWFHTQSESSKSGVSFDTRSNR
jgi:signal transduction histidine kinase